MKQKIDELNKSYRNINSPESQEILKKLHNDLLELRIRFREEMKKYGVIFDNEHK